MPVFVDQLNRQLTLSQKPSRIVSLVPSQTELLFDLGLEDEVIGITKFCVHPDKWFKKKTRIGGTKTINIEKIKGLQPDLIIANKEENEQEQIEELAKDFPVWVSDVNTLNDAYEMMEAIGTLTGKIEEAQTLIIRIKTNFSQRQTPNAKPKTCYLIWKDPYMTVGGDTFINDMLNHAGFKNIFQDRKRYPEVTIAQLQTANLPTGQAGCQLLLLPSEPYPFKQKHIDELRRQLPDTKIILVDGELFSWYGSRLLQVPAYFKNLQQQIAAMEK